MYKHYLERSLVPPLVNTLQRFFRQVRSCNCTYNNIPQSVITGAVILIRDHYQEQF